MPTYAHKTHTRTHMCTHTHNTNKLATVQHMIVDLKVSLKVFCTYCQFLPIVWGRGHERKSTAAFFDTYFVKELALQLMN